MKGVIWTDVFQTVVMIGGLIAIAIVVRDLKYHLLWSAEIIIFFLPL